MEGKIVHYDSFLSLVTEMCEAKMQQTIFSNRKAPACDNILLKPTDWFYMKLKLQLQWRLNVHG